MILLIGAGRLATHLDFYLKQSNIHFERWKRQEKTSDLYEKLSKSKRILLAITDSAIEPFYEQTLKPELPTDHLKKIVHFSGALQIAELISCHPLMTFGDTLYDIGTYKKIPFVLEKEGPDFSDLFPELSNPHHKIDANHRALYHALAVCSANLPQMLWQKSRQLLETKTDIPFSLYFPLIEQAFKNTQIAVQNQKPVPLTGPLIRKDKLSIQKNMEALSTDPLHAIYQSFLESNQP